MSFELGTRDQAGGVAGEAQASVPGKQTLTGGVQRQVQRDGAGGASASTAQVHAAAERGIDTPSTSLPHKSEIQAAFGPSVDLSGVQAHVGGGAATAASDMGATAFASGNHVAFASQPDLHTAAHEAAHVVQQAQGVNLYGGVGEAGDAYEQHADAVADRVVAGQSAADLFTSGPIAQVPAGGWGANVGGSIQRKIAAPTVQMKGDAPGAGGGAAAAAPAPAAGGGGAAAAPAAGGKVAKLHLFVDIEAPSIGIKELKEGAVGHTWIAIEYNDPATVPATVNAAHLALLRTGGKYSDPMGFWPDIQNGVGYSTNPFDSYVDGWMRHPDRAHEGAEKAMQTWEITQAEVDAVIAYAESKRGAKYSVYFFNCTTFGVQAVAAAGKNAPSGGGAIMYPNALYQSIKKRQEKGQGETMVKDFDGTNERTSHGADTKKNG
jgi:hypothetical protein